ncbi:MAG: mannosyltransferase [Solirubrobacteraceae bacterium]|jgi:4-amino-4-deoxy-L-arabinose transferase-like glycosyltransferase|nr:mannosyltransferase [Solirubrobacteraceae bacterium]
MTTTTPRRSVPWLLQAPEVPDVHAPRWFHRLPAWLSTGGILVVLLALSALVRSRYISGQLWGDEAIAVGIASHPLGAIPGILRLDGSAPLYYMVLHVWATTFGSGEVAVHLLSLLLGLLSVPVAMWAGWSLFGRRTGMAAAVLFAFSPFLTHYAEEAQPYELLALLGLIATACFLHAFVRRRRGFLVPLALVLTLALYTSIWAIFFWAGAAVALWLLWRSTEERTGLLRDGVLTFGAALVLFVPWIPTLIDQIGQTTSPWGYGDLAGFGFPSSLLGSDRVTVSLAVALAVAALPLATRERRGTALARMLWSLMVIALAAALLARFVSIVSPVWETRYLASILGALLLLGAVACARSGILGVVALVLTLAFAANAASFAPQHKSDMRDVAGELASYMRPGDVVVVGQPEQSPLAYYYLPAGLRFASPMGPIAHPSYMDWVDAYSRLKAAQPVPTVGALVASLRPGQRLLYARPLTEGIRAWTQSWSMLVRRRAAQWGALLATDPRLVPIAGAVAPHNYRGACCVADSAIVYTRVP